MLAFSLTRCACKKSNVGVCERERLCCWMHHIKNGHLALTGKYATTDSINARFLTVLTADSVCGVSCGDFQSA